MKTLPDTIARLEKEVEAISGKIADPSVAARDPSAFTTLTQKLATLQTELHQAEEQWLELEMLREEIES